MDRPAAIVALVVVHLAVLGAIVRWLQLRRRMPLDAPSPLAEAVGTQHLVVASTRDAITELWPAIAWPPTGTR